MMHALRSIVAWCVVLVGVPAGASAPWVRAGIDGAVRPVVINTMTDHYIAGAAVAVVKDGSLVYAEGFGDREVYGEVPVDAATTIFRIGSVTKVLTGIAVMQLVDAGKVGVADDVNEHLQSIQVDDAFGEPVRVRNLLTHTAGFDQLGYGRHAGSAAEVLPLADFLRGSLVRIRAPGECSVYDTYGITLAGLLVEDVSGLAYEDYLDRNIFAPLGMERSGIAVPDDMRGDVATGYGFAGEWEAMPWEYMNTAPASTANATVTDMARLMIVLLNGGVYESGRILSQKSATAMLTRQFTNDPRLPGFGYIFFEDNRLGVPAMSHGGSMEGFGCMLYLVPSEQLGVFVACNQESSVLADVVVEAVLRAGLPHRIAEHERLPRRDDVDVTRFAGTYANAMHNHTRPERGGWPAKPFDVDAGEDGTLVVFGGRAIPVGDDLFQRDDGAFIVFDINDGGVVERMFVGQSVYERIRSE